MAIIKTKLRNCLSIITLDAHMMVASNCPKRENYAADYDGYAAYKAAVDDLIERAVAHWREKVTRNINKSHPGLARRKRNGGKTVSLADLL